MKRWMCDWRRMEEVASFPKLKPRRPNACQLLSVMSVRTVKSENGEMRDKKRLPEISFRHGGRCLLGREVDVIFE